MSDTKQSIPYAVQKTNKPSIEEVIASCFEGDLQKSALGFAAFMRENNTPFKLFTSTTRSQMACHKKERLCQIIVYGEDDWKHVNYHQPGDPPYWNLIPVLTHLNDYKDTVISQNWQPVLWDNVFYCAHDPRSPLAGKGCSPNKKCAGGRSITILDKTIDGICYGRTNPIIRNPDEAMVEIVKELLVMEVEARV